MELKPALLAFSLQPRPSNTRFAMRAYACFPFSLAKRCTLPLVAVLLPLGVAQAQERSGWIDPPAKADEAQSKTVEPLATPTKAVGPVRSSVATSPEPALKRRASALAEKPARERAYETNRSVTPAVQMPVRSEVAVQADSRLSEAARRTAYAYLAAVSSNAEIASSTPDFYGQRVRFHGRDMSRSALAAEKARFARRWPQRRYEARGEPRARCNDASGLCSVTAAFDFQAANPTRGARSAGTGELTMIVAFSSGRPIIVVENSHVLRRGTTALSSANRSGGAS